MTANTTACGWDVEGCDSCDALQSLDPAVRTLVEEMAVDRLWKWTGRRFGPCEVTVRPCRRSCAEQGGYVPALIGGQFTNLQCGSCVGDCSCKTIHEAMLPGPVQSIVEIRLNGALLGIDKVRVDDYSFLVRIDGGTWPTCQDLTKQPTEDNTWAVTYTRGEPVPPGGGLVAGVLACEYAKSLCGDTGCRLPRRVQTVTRQGITVGFLDNFTDLEKGRTGLWEVDDWVVSQTAPRREGQVSSPDVPRQRRTTFWVNP